GSARSAARMWDARRETPWCARARCVRRSPRCAFCAAATCVRLRRESCVSWMMSSARRAGSRLADLAPDALVDVADALALVRLRRPQRAEVGRELPDPAAVDALDPDDHVAVDGDRETFGHGELDRMRVAEQQCELLAGRLRAIADALDLELARERRHHALHHVAHARAHEAAQRPGR